jgi:hypothetical protein
MNLNLLKNTGFQEVRLQLLEFANQNGSLKTAYRWVQV